MRDLILKMFVSLDGFAGSPDGGLKWVFNQDQEARAWGVETVSNTSLHIMGSRTFRDMAGYWPTSTDIFAPPMNRIPKAVFTKQGPAILKNATTTGALQPGGDSWAKAYVAGGDLAAEIAALKAQDGKPIVAHGGASFARSLIAQGLIDQYCLLVCPVALGKGVPIFSDLAQPKPFKLIGSKVFPKGAVAQIYRPA